MSRRTIQSPGVEIREIDLSQRPAAAVGTSVFIAGFSNQGPTDEIFNVGTFSEFEEIYGKPTNAAERYFYHSTKQVFQSDANVYVSRLPYGSGTGQGTEKYSALVYPVIDANTSPITATATGSVGTATGTIGLNMGVGNIGGGVARPFIAEIVSKDSNDNIKYTSISATATYSPTPGDVTIAAGELVSSGYSGISADTLIVGNALSGGNVAKAASAISSTSKYLIFGNPAQVELTKSQYLSVADGNFTWATTGSATTYTPDNLGNSGLIILNKSKLTTNNSFEGYYVGMTDNSNLSPTTPYDVIGDIKATTSIGNKAPGGFTSLPSSRYDFALSSTSTSEKPSVSRTLENVSKFDLDGGQFIDTLTIGIFKVRITPFSNTDLQVSHFLSEGYAGSLNSFRKIQNENGGNRLSFFLEDLDDSSNDIKILTNPTISKDPGDWTSTLGDAPTKFVRTIRDDNTNAAIVNAVADAATGAGFTETPGLVSLGVYTDVLNDSAKNIGSIPDKLDRVFNIASNVDLFKIDVSVEGGLGTVYAVGTAQGNSAYDDTAFVDVSGTSGGFYTTNDSIASGDSAQITLRDNYRTIFNQFEVFARSTRKDHIFIADVLKPLVVQGDNGKVLDDKDKNFSKHVYWPLRHQFGSANSNFATTYGNWAKVYDGTSDKQIWIPFSGVAGKIYANNDANFAPWYAPAGFNRGVVTGVNDIAVSPTQRQRDQLYRIAINPVTQFPAEGIVIFGQKTLQRKPTAFDRVNVRRCFLDLEKRTRETLKFFIFEPNTFLTRNRVVNTLTPIFENCKQTEGVYDYLIVCDERNNPASVIDQNELRVDIYLKPVRAAEFILVNFYAVNTDVNFEEIVGQ